MKVLILGASGMLGSATYHIFGEQDHFEVYGTLRSEAMRQHLGEANNKHLVSGVDVDSIDSVSAVFGKVNPDLVINCIGVIKQLESAKDPLTTLPINALLPHRLANFCKIAGARLIHVSTDCVFSGKNGLRMENDQPDATDLYGISKLLGEVHNVGTITLRTSIIGEELSRGGASLLGWFLSQQGPVKGFRKAVFSGLPTVVLARIMRDIVVPRPEMHGLYHVSAEPINKFDLLSIIKDVYGRDTEIVPDETFVIDRSLNSDRFRALTGFQPSPWPDMIAEMHAKSRYWNKED